MRYLVADVYTDSYFELIIDLILRDTLLLADKYIVRLIYAFNATSATATESVTKTLDEDKTYTIVYALSQNFTRPLKFVRNICMDACKGLQLKKCDNCMKSDPLDSSYYHHTNSAGYIDETVIISNENRSNNSSYHYYKVYQLALLGKGRIDNGIFREQVPHFELAKLTADYLVNSQSGLTGGWPVNVTRKFDFLNRLHVVPGWHSGMAQGHALSLLSRLFAHTKDAKYLDAIERALGLYERDVEDGGIRAYFILNGGSASNSSLVWFEEYPTRPERLFVLNGFIYSIFGLSDFVTCGFRGVDYGRAKRVLFESLRSLRALVNLYDTGSRTLYDLRHVFNPFLNPNVARWDYHTLHVSQLFYLTQILEDYRLSSTLTAAESRLLAGYADVFRVIAKRWLGYLDGVWQQNSQVKLNDK
jgi:hypothetical protein